MPLIVSSHRMLAVAGYTRRWGKDAIAFLQYHHIIYTLTIGHSKYSHTPQILLELST
ncbi:hypothetical protein H6F60_13490 [Coleofasciculus sp. FACHB-129]|nr:hypothetical protein [Coleofasciculus sp. FACHB-129]